MKATGIIRNIDSLGRVVVPKGIRKAYGLDEGTPVEVFTTEEGILFKKYQKGCHCCNEIGGLEQVMGIDLCKSCIEKFNKCTSLLLDK